MFQLLPSIFESLLPKLFFVNCVNCLPIDQRIKKPTVILLYYLQITLPHALQILLANNSLTTPIQQISPFILKNLINPAIIHPYQLYTIHYIIIHCLTPFKLIKSRANNQCSTLVIALLLG